MARNPRRDAPDSWHHIMNRGLARRTAFEGRADVRRFLALLARAVRRGEVEVHAYCILMTHFHLLVRSPRGLLSEALRRVQNEYVRWFNRSRRRDGPLFRGRFRSKPVESLTYRRVLVRYIDANPVRARLTQVAAHYPFGSARAYATRSGPPWLERSWIEELARGASEARVFDPRAYAATFAPDLPPGLARVIEARIEGRHRGPDPLDDLVGAAPEKVLAWMRRKARLADGTSPGLPVCSPATVSAAVEAARVRAGAWLLRHGRRGRDAWPQVHAALLRDLAGLPSQELALRVGCSESSISRLRARHRDSMDDERYAARVLDLVREAVREWDGV